MKSQEGTTSRFQSPFLVSSKLQRRLDYTVDTEAPGGTSRIRPGAEVARRATFPSLGLRYRGSRHCRANEHCRSTLGNIDHHGQGVPLALASRAR